LSVAANVTTTAFGAARHSIAHRAAIACRAMSTRTSEQRIFVMPIVREIPPAPETGQAGGNT
jgi:hypothetical protein